jgi:hypothetical protein
LEGQHLRLVDDLERSSGLTVDLPSISGRGSTSPRTRITSSARSDCESLAASPHSSGRKTIWVRPSRSRRSMKITPPWSRVVWTQPIRVTDEPTSELRIWLQW